MLTNNPPTVAVLMSTFNGEKYIREQLDSIFNQIDVNVKLFVRDDGSTDSTLDIIYEYNINKSVVIIADGENVGPGESFMRLVYRFAHVDSIDYYAFADQDDIWLEDKLSVAVNRIINSGETGPVLYSSNQFLFINGENKGPRHKDTQSVSLIPHITKNTISGCTFVFNKAFAQIVASADKPDKRILKYRLHDSWLMLVGIVTGHVIYDDTPHMLYRIHSDNTVGIKGQPLLKRLGKLQRFFVDRDDANLRMITSKELLRLFPSINEKDKTVLLLFANYQKSWKDKTKLAFNRSVLSDCAESPIIFSIKVLLSFV